MNTTANLPRLSRADFYAGERGTVEGRSPESRNRQVLRDAEKEASAWTFYRDPAHYSETAAGVVGATTQATREERRLMAAMRNEFVLMVAE